MNDMLHLVYDDPHLVDHQRRVEESLCHYRLFRSDQPHTGASVSVGGPARWVDVDRALQLLWTLAYGLARCQA